MTKTLYAVVLAAILAAPAFAPAAEVSIGASDTMESALKGQKGRVTLRLRSGQEITGTVRAVTGRLVHLGALTGREFFDAVVPLEAVEAMLVRTKD